MNDTTMNNKSGMGIHAFVVDSNVHDNYSAFRLNNNSSLITMFSWSYKSSWNRWSIRAKPKKDGNLFSPFKNWQNRDLTEMWLTCVRIRYFQTLLKSLEEYNNVRNNFPRQNFQPSFHQNLDRSGAMSLRESLHTGIMHSHPNYP